MCGKTLLDTIDHVLDHAKINDFANKKLNGRSKRHKRLKRGRSDAEDSAERAAYSTEDSSPSNMTLLTDFDLSNVIEEVVEAIYAGHTFKRGQRAEGAFDRQDVYNASKEVRTYEDYNTNNAGGAGDIISYDFEKFMDVLSIILDIDYHEDYFVNSQAGAIRRIAMNLMGNSLKYTENGYVKISVSLTDPVPNVQGRKITISCVDTGKGISKSLSS